MKHYIFTFILLFASALFSNTTSVNNNINQSTVLQLTQIEQDWINENQVISFTGDPNWLPYEAFKEDGTYIGIVADYLHLIEEATNLKFETQMTSSWSESLELATTNKVKVISGDAADAILNKKFNPVDAYSHNPIVIVMDIHKNYIQNLEEIANKKIAIIKDYGYTADIFKMYPEIDFIEVSNIQEGLEGVAHGRFDALLATMALASYTITQMHLHNIKVVGKTPIVMDLTLFISKNEPILHSIINKVLHSISEKDTQKISQKWVSQEYVENIDETLLLQIFAIIFILLFIVVLWNYRMSKEIDKRIKVQMSLEKSKKDLQDIFDNAQSGLMYITGDRVLIKGNQRLADIFEYENPEEMIGFSMQKLHLSEENYINYGKMNFDTLRMGVKRHIEYELRRKDGSSIWCELSGKALDDNIPADMSKGVLWTINDISLRKKYEFSLKKSEEKYKSLFHGNKAIELIIDPQNLDIVDCNKSAENFYGYSRDALLNMKINDINILSNDEVQEEIRLAKESAKEVFHFKHQLNDGTIKDVEVYSGPIELDGKAYLYSIIFDITKKIELEKIQNLLQERLSYAIEGSNDGLWDWNVKTNEVFFSPRWKEILGYDNDEIEHTLSNWEELLYPDDIKPTWEELERFLASNNSKDRFKANFRMKHKEGQYVPILSRARKVFDSNGEVERLVGTHVDMSELYAVQEKIEKQHEFLQNVIDSVGDSIMVIEKDYTVSLMNEAARKNINQKWISDSSKPKCYELSHHRNTPCDGNEHPCPLEQVLENKTVSRVTHTHEDVNKNEIIIELTVVPLLNEDNEVEAIIESAHDITELKNTQKSLQHQAEHDALTNLPNRILFIDRLNQAIKHASRLKEKVAVLFMDLDHFKEINDSLGHRVGDILLQQVSERLLKSIRESDTVARLGGDEFTIIIDQVTSLDTITSVIQKIMHIFNQPFLIEDHSLYVTMSIGVAMYPEDGKNADMLLKNADAAMYKAKHSGRNNYQYYTQDMTEHAFERIILETQLRESIEKNELEVYYQLQVDATTDQIKGMEALIRWNHPNLGIVSPDKFIPLAEDTGFIIAIDDWVMQQALVQFKKWYDLGYNPGVLSLNLSPLRLEQEEFISKLDKALKSTSVQSSWLNLEITEGQIMRNPEKAIETLNKIHNLGIGLAIDDFGTGYSSLAYLKKLPIDKLKIDQSFVRDIPKDNDDVEITKTIISMTKNLSLSVIAEGVETQEQKEFLVANGCNEIQGYFYHKPSTAKDVEKILVSGIN